MELTTQRQLIQAVAWRWRKTYSPFSDESPLFSVRKGFTSGLTRSQIADALDALDLNTASVEDVANIIGNDSWTRLKCDECRALVEVVLRVGEAPDYESQTACLCMDCVKRASEISLAHG